MQLCFVGVRLALAGKRLLFVSTKLLAPFIDSGLAELILPCGLRLRFARFNLAKNF